MLFVLAAFLASWRYSDMLWAGGTIATATTIVCAVRRFRLLMRWLAPTLLATYSLLMSFASISEGVIRLRHFSTERVALATGNPNLLAASLAVAGVAAGTLTRGPLRHLIFLLTMTAIAFTGSRTAVLAVTIAAVAVVGLRGDKLRWGPIAAVGAAFSLIVGTALVTSKLMPAPTVSKNLLTSSAYLRHSSWSTRHAESAAIEVVRQKGPEIGGTVSRLQATSNPAGRYPTIVLTNSIGPSTQSAPYIASAYFRASVPQQLRLSSNLASVVCDVTPAWQRCVTPVSYGDGNTTAQFQIRTMEPGNSIDIQIWGAQLEFGLRPSAVEHTGLPAIAYYWRSALSPRLDPSAWLQSASLQMKGPAFVSAWRLFLSNPVNGVGREESAQAFRALTQGDMQSNHAHNLILQLLAESGVLGLASWATLFLGFISSTWKSSRRDLTPLLLVVATLNMTDFTFYFSGSYYAMWFAIAVLAFQKDGPV